MYWRSSAGSESSGPPAPNPGLGPLRVQMVLAQEVGALVGVEPLEWAPLTTAAVEGFEQACEKLAWHSQRWGIACFLRTLKRGGRVGVGC